MENTNQQTSSTPSVGQPVVPASPNHQSITLLIVMGIVLLLVIVLGAYVLGGMKKNENLLQNQLQPTPSIPSDQALPLSPFPSSSESERLTSNWLVYKQFLFQVKYPQTYSVDESYFRPNGVEFRNTTKAGTCTIVASPQKDNEATNSGSTYDKFTKTWTETISINGLKTQRLHFRRSLTDDEAITIKHNNVVYLLKATGISNFGNDLPPTVLENMKTCELIFSTFQPIEHNP